MRSTNAQPTNGSLVRNSSCSGHLLSLRIPGPSAATPAACPVSRARKAAITSGWRNSQKKCESAIATTHRLDDLRLRAGREALARLAQRTPDFVGHLPGCLLQLAKLPGNASAWLADEEVHTHGPPFTEREIAVERLRSKQRGLLALALQDEFQIGKFHGFDSRLPSHFPCKHSRNNNRARCNRTARFCRVMPNRWQVSSMGSASTSRIWKATDMVAGNPWMQCWSEVQNSLRSAGLFGSMAISLTARRHIPCSSNISDDAASLSPPVGVSRKRPARRKWSAILRCRMATSHVPRALRPSKLSRLFQAARKASCTTSSAAERSAMREIATRNSMSPYRSTHASGDSVARMLFAVVGSSTLGLRVGTGTSTISRSSRLTITVKAKRFGKSRRRLPFYTSRERGAQEKTGRSHRSGSVPWSFLALSGASCLHLGQLVDQVDGAAAVAPLVVVPADNLDHVVADRGSPRTSEDRAVRITDDVGRDNRVLGVAQDAL